LADIPSKGGRSRSDNGPEFTAGSVREWLKDVGAKTLYIQPGSPWENGYAESFNGKFRDELLDREIFYTLKEVQILIEMWRKEYNRIRPHSSMGYRPPAPEAVINRPTRGRTNIIPDTASGGRSSPSRMGRNLHFALIFCHTFPPATSDAEMFRYVSVRSTCLPVDFEAISATLPQECIFLYASPNGAAIYNLNLLPDFPPLLKDCSASLKDALRTLNIVLT
jgi:hypothetical protein